MNTTHFFAHSPSPSSFLENKMLGLAVACLKLWRQKLYAKGGGAAPDWPSFDFLLRKKTNAELTQFSHGNQISVTSLTDLIQPPTPFYKRGAHWSPERHKDTPKVNKSVIQMKWKNPSLDPKSNIQTSIFSEYADYFQRLWNSELFFKDYW